MKPLGKTTMISVSTGTVAAVLFAVWTASGIGRPLFAADLVDVQMALINLDNKTTIAFLEQQKSGLQTEIRSLRRELRADPSDTDLLDDIEEVEADIADIDASIACIRTEGCSL